MASTGDTWRLGRRPALDGLRGVAVLLVVISHAQPPGLSIAGHIGVSMFFALSGFLITTLLLEEHQRTGRISLAAFYRRRAARLLPALAVFLAAAGTLLAYLGALRPREFAGVVLYVANWLRVDEANLGILAHTWSLAIEEQFYVLWPLVLIALVGRVPRAVLAGVTVVGILTSLVLRASLWDSGAGLNRVFYGTDTHADELLIGCLLAVVMVHQRDRIAQPRVAALGVVAVVAVAALGGATWFLFATSLTAAVTAAVIWAVARDDYAGWLNTRWLGIVGQRSYGLYLWHWPVFFLAMPRLELPWLTETLLLAGLSWGATCLSWSLVEQPILRRRRASRAALPSDVVVGRRPLRAEV